MKTLTDLRKTVETGVDPRLLIQHIYFDSSYIVSFILFNSSMISPLSPYDLSLKKIDGLKV